MRVIDKIDNHISLINVINNCGYLLEDYSIVDERLKLFSQALCMGEFPFGKYTEYFLSPAENYLMDNFLFFGKIIN